ncbi:hypothetical protein ACIQVK_36450 [Streptomyces sp. NPDC090493]|uniref:hypothetical protein n=1 Tax=Streptomyces sp. NPDC090493 TaxID=3365964 RepID=UPI0037F21F43
MTSPAVLPGTAVRVLRTAPGRRALHLALLVGGLLALGLLCGQRAQAAEGVPPNPSPAPSLTSTVTSAVTSTVNSAVTSTVNSAVTSTVTSAVTSTVNSAVTSAVTSAVPQKRPAQDAVTPHRELVAAHREPVAVRKPVVKAVSVVDGAGEAVRSVTGTASDTVTGTGTVSSPVASPVTSALTESLTASLTGTLTETITRTLTETVRQVTELPVVPVVQVPELPVVSDPQAGSDPAPVTPAPGPAQAQPRTPVTHVAGHEKPATKAASATATTAASYGPRNTAAVTFASGRAPHTDGHRADRVAGAPAHPAPAGDPDGVLGKAAVDAAPSRQGDAHAATFAGRAPLGLAPGTAARTEAAGTRDRYRDIPLFPG